MASNIALIGFGEAAQAFALGGTWGTRAMAFDRKTDDPVSRHAKLRDYQAAGVREATTLDALCAHAKSILSLVTADQALEVARSCIERLRPGTFYCDGNSVAPATKQAAARLIDNAGGHYVDMAIMSPVEPARLAVPILLSGARAEAAEKWLTSLGFRNIRIVGDTVGRASSIKMIRSVMVKGMEALTAECVRAADAAGVLDEVLASLDASEKARPWTERADYNLDRMLVHGLRRAAEMEEVGKTLEDLGTGSAMTRGALQRQRELGGLGIGTPPAGLGAKIAAIATVQEERKNQAA